MPGFESPNFKKNFPSNQKPLREFNVGPQNADEEFYESPQEPDINQVQAEFNRQKAASNRIDSVAKKRIEILANIGRHTKDVPLGGFVFSLRTLKAKESREAALATFSTSLTQVEASYEARKQQLARSIFQIDGEEIELILGSVRLEDRMSFIEDNLEDVVVEKLWEEFMSLKEEAKKKYGINNTKEAEEVSEDLKK